MKRFPIHRSSLLSLLKILLLSLVSGVMLAVPPGLMADERAFTYSYEATSVLPKGGVELEQWITSRAGKENGRFVRWDLREEIEFGVTDRYTTALYLNFRNTHSDGVSSRSDTDDFEFKGISSEHKYQVLNPHLKPLGLLLYGEVTTDGEEVELEEKLVLQKLVGERWNFVFNAILEQEWEFEAGATEKELIVELTAGVSYRLSPHWSVGLEARNHRILEDFDDQVANAFFLGPNIHWGTGKWWATLTVLPQVAGSPETDSNLELHEHERIEVRLIAGYNF